MKMNNITNFPKWLLKAFAVVSLMSVSVSVYAIVHNDDSIVQMVCPCDFSLQQFSAEEAKVGITPNSPKYWSCNNVASQMDFTSAVFTQLNTQLSVLDMSKKPMQGLINSAELMDKGAGNTQGQCTQQYYVKDQSFTTIQQHAITTKQYMACMQDIKALAVQLNYFGCN